MITESCFAASFITVEKLPCNMVSFSFLFSKRNTFCNNYYTAKSFRLGFFLTEELPSFVFELYWRALKPHTFKKPLDFSGDVFYM